MKPIEVDLFRRELICACREAFNEASAINHLYGFSVLVDRSGSAISAVGQSEAQLLDAVEKELARGYWKSTKSDLVANVSKMKRWNSEEWADFEPLFGKVNALLNESYVSSPSEFKGNGWARLVFTTCLSTLAELDACGTFDLKVSRDQIVLNLCVGDQSDEELLRWAGQVNPHHVLVRYSSELQAGRVAFSELIYVGPA